ncbi:hypothetical protein [Pseudomonas matsuisoli]|uniref:hypothetical protein n=1 Tax=Pseudomonas matsuisoli TaxID=1515666 RepID=UPI00166A0512|nr:hypothetical protein [Pseudomonas matsuisoli]
MSKRPTNTIVAAAGASLLLAGCANHLPQRSENEQRVERTLRDHLLQIDAGDPPIMELPQRRIRVTEQRRFDVTDYEVTRLYDRYTPYQAWRELYEIPAGAVAIVAGVAANALNVVLLGNVPAAATKGWIQYGIDGLNPAMNVESNGRSQQNLAGIQEVERDRREEFTNLPWAQQPVQLDLNGRTYDLQTDRNGYLKLNLLDSPFPERNLSRLASFQLKAVASDETVGVATVTVSRSLRAKLDEAHALVFDDLEDGEISQWVHRVARLSELGLEQEANELEQSLIELTRNDPELQAEFIQSLQEETGRKAADPGPGE